MVRFFPFTLWHGKKDTGSTNIRVNQLIKYWDEADNYKYGEHPDVLIYQKVYWVEDWLFQEHFDGIQILDICDPDWLDNAYIKRTVDCMDAITVPTKRLQSFIQQLTDKPVKIIKDRFDIAELPKPKIHSGKAKRVVWFGYMHNADLLKNAIQSIEKLGLGLTIISDDDPIAYRWALNPEEFKKKYTFYKYNEETFYKRLQTCDICVLPKGFRPKDKFKSNNRTIKAYLAGLPVAKSIDELEKYMDSNNRIKDSEYNYKKAIKEYDVKLSIKEYKELIDEVKHNK